MQTDPALYYRKEFERGLELALRQFNFAALEVWQCLEQTACADSAQVARLHDEIGKIYVHLGRYEQSAAYFGNAIAYATDANATVRYHMHMALLYRRLSEHDKAQRILAQLIDEYAAKIDSSLGGLLYGNLAIVQSYNEFHNDALVNSIKSLHCLSAGEMLSYHADLYTNIGLHYLDLGDLDAAKTHFLRALELRSGAYLPPLAELSRLYMIAGDIENSLIHARKALELVWSSFIAFEKEEIARLCHLLANLAHHLGESHVALRLIEKAQLFFGKLRLWREWQLVQAVMDDWSLKPAFPAVTTKPEELTQLRRFVTLLDAMNAQELIHERFSALLDCRVLYATEFAEALSLSPEERQVLVYACRFADYGLTAVEADVVLSPKRSVYAFERYKQHPKLSEQMLSTVDLPPTVLQVILHHHEQFDGGGFPLGLAGGQIPFLAQIFAVADWYATGVAFAEKTHSHVLREIAAERGVHFAPALADAFLQMFAADV